MADGLSLGSDSSESEDEEVSKQTKKVDGPIVGSKRAQKDSEDKFENLLLFKKPESKVPSGAASSMISLMKRVKNDEVITKIEEEKPKEQSKDLFSKLAAYGSSSDSD